MVQANDVQRGQRAAWLLAIIVLWALGLCTHVPVGAAEKKPERDSQRVIIAYSSISGNMAPLWITYERGFFRKYGLNVELVLVEGGSKAAQSLAAGQVSFAQMAGAGVIQTNLKGADVVMIAGILNTMTYQLIVDKDIQRPEQLKSKALAVSRFGSSSDYAIRFILDKYRLIPEKDVRILEIGTQPDRFAALTKGTVQGVLLEPPQSLEAKKLGFHVLANLKMLGLEYQHTGLATTRALIESQPDLIRNVLKAYVEGIHYYKTERKQSLAILAKYLKTSNAEALNEIYEDVGRALVPTKPYPTLKGIGTMLQEIAGTIPDARKVRPEQLVDLRFIKELDTSGFIDQLYKAKPVVIAEKPQRLPDQPVSYVIKAGDTLSHLAEWFYGSALKWGRIYEANRKVIINPDYIYVGQQIIVPAAT